MCLNKLGVASEHQKSFIKESLVYLPGWAGYVKWRSVWKNANATDDCCPVTLVDFIAVRLVLTAALWPEARWEKKIKNETTLIESKVAQIIKSEQQYQHELIKQLMPQVKNIRKK